MLRLVHNQTVQGAILVDDIDDGLPNKTAHRLGSVGDPKAYKRDGYANEPKQAVYVPFANPVDATQAGYVDLNETQRVLLSQDSGKIAGLESAGYLTVVSMVASDLDAPLITSATIDAPAAGDVTIVGTNMASVAPDVTSVRAFGAGVGDVTLTQSQIVAVAPGAVGNTSIIIDSTLLPSLLEYIASTGVLTGTLDFGNNETVTIDTKVYTFQTTLTDVDGHVQIDGTLAGSLLNLLNANNLTGTPGTDYALSTTIHPTVTATASDATTLTVEAKTPGTVGDTIATTDTAGNADWGAATLASGQDGDQVTVTADGNSVTAYILA
jgi:hypothetical protein